MSLKIKKLRFFLVLIAYFQCSQLTGKPIYLNFNESFFGPPPEVIHAMSSALVESDRYPDEAIIQFTSELAKFHSLNSNQVLLDSGLSSIIYTLAETFLGPHTKLIIANPTFELLKDFAEKKGTKIVQVNLKEDYSHDLDSMLKQVDASTTLIYICNPNNPTGTVTPRAEIEKFLKKLPPHVYVFIDEAYHHFAVNASDYLSFIDHPISNDHVIVGRTFSKAYGLAGMRLGYAISSVATIDKMKPHSLSFSINNAVLKGALEALKNETVLQNAVKKILDSREDFYKNAKMRGLNFIPSYGNFVMLEVVGHPIQEVIEHFKKHEIIIGREFPHMKQHVRISLGSPVDMQQFWKVWDQLGAVFTS